MASTQAVAKESGSFYTLQIEQEGDLATLEKTARYVARLLSLRTRIVKDGGNYVIRIGKSLRSDELEAHIPSLNSVGFWAVSMLDVHTDTEELVKVISPELPESASQTQRHYQPYLLQSRQEALPKVERRMGELFPAEIEISRLIRLRDAMDKEQPGESSVLIQRAWEALHHGSIVDACELFESVQKLPGVEQEALRGLAHCFLRMGNYDQAITLFSWLIEKGIRPEENRVLLVEALFKANKLDSAQEEADHLEEMQARQWRGLISTAKRDIELARVKKLYDPKNPEAFVTKYQSYMDQCLLSDTFLAAAKDLMAVKNEAAARILEQLLDSCAGHWDVKLSAFTGLMQILPPEMMSPRIDRELERINLPFDYREKLLAGAVKFGLGKSKDRAIDKSKNDAKQLPVKGDKFK
ncbi:tetratricopeptide repeat protein [Candidatus Methylobacter oryzae]|uniref:Tetratricopeptide repeat protein n=1 Tax=Candidatus Methylobacter oryzae TaxID=2497749 RepID=A0ABY3CHI6_9GAMM|nr:hypothetical protein [Candidatus Methylobacter oryzae]TRX03590.1 hypothetical protein EKO24_000390 [Candidatus Methylobacter oryzae]